MSERSGNGSKGVEEIKIQNQKKTMSKRFETNLIPGLIPVHLDLQKNIKADCSFHFSLYRSSIPSIKLHRLAMKVNIDAYLKLVLLNDPIDQAS